MDALVHISATYARGLLPYLILFIPNIEISQSDQTRRLCIRIIVAAAAAAAETWFEAYVYAGTGSAGTVDHSAVVAVRGLL
jgi:hypothetical protein